MKSLIKKQAKKEVSKAAQCCAKQSKNAVGCHD
jgi:hypothetical protein